MKSGFKLVETESTVKKRKKDVVAEAKSNPVDNFVNQSHFQAIEDSTPNFPKLKTMRFSYTHEETISLDRDKENKNPSPPHSPVKKGLTPKIQDKENQNPSPQHSPVKSMPHSPVKKYQLLKSQSENLNEKEINDFSNLSQGYFDFKRPLPLPSNVPLNKEEPKEKEEQKEKEEKPILVLNKMELNRVIQILRGKNNSNVNCTALAEGIINYFKTGKIPTAPASEKYSLDHFSYYIEYEEVPFQIKVEGKKNVRKDRKISAVVSSKINRNTLFGCQAQHDTKYREENGVIDLNQPYIEKNASTMKLSHINLLEQCLIYEASQDPSNVSFGIILLTHCGKYVDTIGHVLVYYATHDPSGTSQVNYIDAQFYNQPQKGWPIFNNLLNAYRFAGFRDNRITSDTFGSGIYFSKMGPFTKEQQLSHEPIKPL